MCELLVVMVVVVVVRGEHNLLYPGNVNGRARKIWILWPVAIRQMYSGFLWQEELSGALLPTSNNWRLCSAAP